MDRLSELPIEMREQILARIDLPELYHLKLLNHEFLQIIESPMFTTIYNQRSQSSGSPWKIMHYFDENAPHIGALLMVRESDNREIRYPLQPVLNEYINGNGELNLLAASGSLLLFSYLQEETDHSMLVLNVFARQVHKIMVPQEMILDVDFTDCNRFLFKLERPPLVQMLTYSIKFVGMDDHLIPKWCSFDFQMGAYVWQMTNARPFNLQEPKPPSQDFTMHGHGDFVYLVSPCNNEICYHQQPLPLEFQGAQYDEDDMNPPPPWDSRVDFTYGTQGLGVGMLMVFIHANQDEMLAMNLFRLSQDLDKYVYVAHVPIHMLPIGLINVISPCNVQQNEDKIDIGFVTTSEGADDGEVFRMTHYKYNLSTRQWSQQIINQEDINMLHSPVFTTKLTIGCI